MRKWIIGIVLLISLPVLIYRLGPVTGFEAVSTEIVPLSISIEELETWIEEKEKKVKDLKENNEARVIWADSVRQTEWAIVYLHGFSASQQEGNPVHETIARTFGMNLYLSRLAGHGIDSEDSFAELTPSQLINSAKEAIAIGQVIGKKVLLMSCSTGSTYSIYLAAHHPDLIDALVMYSPNISLYDPNARLLSGPWGLQIGQALLGKQLRYEENIGTPKEQYTTSVYRVEGLVALQATLDQTMKKRYFELISQPLFVGYYFKNEEEQDKVVSVAAMQEFVRAVGTDKDHIREISFPNAGDHVICSGLHSADYQGVIRETALFLKDILKVRPIESSISSEQSF